MSRRQTKLCTEGKPLDKKTANYLELTVAAATDWLLDFTVKR